MLMTGLLYISLLLAGIGVSAALFMNLVKAEDLTTDNLAPSMSSMTASGGTSYGTGRGCQQGKYCTSGTNEGGGTYTSNFDVPLTEAELNQGFTIDSGVTINSHASNSSLSTCANGVLQSGDCRDIFKLTITLKDGDAVVETFIHQEELDWTGLQNFTYTDTVAENSYGVLSGVFSLYGIDAGYPSGYYGPQFSNPSLTIDYQTALVTEDTTTLITDVIETQTQTQIMSAATGTDSVPTSVTVATVTIPATVSTYASASSVTAPSSNATSSASTPIVTVPVQTASAATETTISTPVIETTAVAPTIAPVAQQTETQQAEETQAEAQIETAMTPAPVEPAAPESSETSEAAPEAAPAAKTTSKTKTQKTKASRKTVAVSTTAVVPVAVPVTPAVAAQVVVNNIAPSQKYGNTAQTVTLVAMGMIAGNKGLFKSSNIPDTPKFFNSSSVPDGPSMVDYMTNYRVFGTSNGIHDALVESQWR
jgi:hypothetical protein